MEAEGQCGGLQEGRWSSAGTTERQSWLGLRTDHCLCHGGARTSGSSKEAAAATPTSAHTALPHPFPNLSEDSLRSVGETDAGWPPRPTHIPKGCCFSILLEKGKESPNKGTCRHWLPGNGDPRYAASVGQTGQATQMAPAGSGSGIPVERAVSHRGISPPPAVVLGVAWPAGPAGDAGAGAPRA